MSTSMLFAAGAAVAWIAEAEKRAAPTNAATTPRIGWVTACASAYLMEASYVMGSECASMIERRVDQREVVPSAHDVHLPYAKQLAELAREHGDRAIRTQQCHRLRRIGRAPAPRFPDRP